MIRAATFSTDGKHRFTLTRIWEPESSSPMLGLIGKNPSVANNKKDDPTIKREISLGERLGCRGLVKVNLYSFIATDSAELVGKSGRILVGDFLSQDLIEALKGCSPIVCCWGTHANAGMRERLKMRGDMVRRLLNQAGVKTYALKVNADGTPGHPLYLPGNLELKEF